jgi:hypothetical protein
MLLKYYRQLILKTRTKNVIIFMAAIFSMTNKSIFTRKLATGLTGWDRNHMSFMFLGVEWLTYSRWIKYKFCDGQCKWWLVFLI